MAHGMLVQGILQIQVHLLNNHLDSASSPNLTSVTKIPLRPPIKIAHYHYHMKNILRPTATVHMIIPSPPIKRTIRHLQPSLRISEIASLIGKVTHYQT